MPISNKELLFSSLTQTHWDIFARETLALIQSTAQPAPQVFISYAWPNRKYPSFSLEQDIQAWLLGLHERLTNLGAQVLFDIKSMTLGANIDDFMQQGVTNSNKILIIGTESYLKRSFEPTNVQKEVEHIRKKVAKQGASCVIPILYRGDFSNALPALGTNNNNIQVLGTDCSNEFLYQKNLVALIESIFQLQKNNKYQQLKKTYTDALTRIEALGLTDLEVEKFAQTKAKEVCGTLDIQQEIVSLAIEQVFKTHPDYQIRPLGTQPHSVQTLMHLQSKYQQSTTVSALFGKPMALEGQYINVQMLYQVKEVNQEPADSAKEFKDARMCSFEDIFSKKQALQITELFLPAKQILQEKQKTSELNPEKPPRFLLIQGRAGIGKTTFINFVSREWSLGRLWQDQFDWVFTLRLRDLRDHRFTAAYENGESWSLADWVYQIHFAGTLDKVRFLLLWEHVISPKLQDKVLFLLDGYDEAPTIHPCQQALTDLLNSQTHKILSSRPYGLSDLPLNRREVEVVGFVDDNVEQYIKLYFGDTQENRAKQIITALKANAPLWGNAHIPVTLNILCGVLEESRDINAMMEQFETMAGLYEQMELALFIHAYSNVGKDAAKHKDQLKALDRKSKKELLVDDVYRESRTYLSALALAGFMDEKLIISPEQLNKTLREAGVTLRDLSEKVRNLLSLGLLKPVLGEEQTSADPIGYEFLHLTFQEYYAGLTLAQKLIQAKDGNDPILSMLHPIKFNPRYQILFWFAAGLLNENPAAFDRLMKIIDDKQHGDVIGHVKLGLQLRCVHEGWNAAQKSGWLIKIACVIQEKIKAYYQSTPVINFNNTQKPIWVEFLNLSPKWLKVSGELDLLAQVDGSENKKIFANFMGGLGLATSTVLMKLANLLHDSDHDIQSSAVYALEKLDLIVATKEILTGLMAGWEQKNYLLRGNIIKVIGKLEGSAATQEFSLALIQLLRNKDVEVRKYAIRVIEKLKPSIITQEFLDALLVLLQDNDRDVRGIAIQVLDVLKSLAATTEFLAGLAVLLRNKDKHLREDVARVITSLRKSAATEEILSALMPMLQDGDMPSSWAVNAISSLGSSVINKAFLSTLALLLDNQDVYPFSNVVKLISYLGKLAATEEIILKLTKLFDSPVGYYRGYAVRALSDIGVADEQFLSKLVTFLFDQEKWVRCNAACAIGKLGMVPVTKELSAQLATLLREEDESVNRYAVEAVCKLAPSIITDEIISALAALLSKPDSGSSVRLTITKLGALVTNKEFLSRLLISLQDKEIYENNFWLGLNLRLSESIISKNFLSDLSLLLEDNDPLIRNRAVDVMGGIEPAMLTKEIILKLNGLLKDKDQKVRDSVLRALERLGPSVATKEILLTLSTLLRDSEQYKTSSINRVIKKFGTAAATPEFLSALADLIRNTKIISDTRYYHAHCNAIGTIGALGQAAATKEFLAELAGLLDNKDWAVCDRAIAAIGEIGPAALTDVILLKLTTLFQRNDYRLADSIAYMMIKFDSSLFTNEIMLRLSLLFYHYNDKEGIDGSISQALASFGAKSATTECLMNIASGLCKTKTFKNFNNILSKLVPYYLAIINYYQKLIIKNYFLPY